MKRFLLICWFLPLFGHGQYAIYNNAYFNTNGRNYTIKNATDTQFYVTPTYIKTYKPLELPLYTTGGVPTSIHNSVIMNSDSSGQPAYIDNSGGVHYWATAYGYSYTPTLTNTTNISLSSLGAATYTRIGNIVHVNVYGDIAPTSGTSAFVLTFTLPISTTSTPAGSGSGTWNSNGSPPSSPLQSGIVFSASNTTATFSVYNNTAFTSSNTFSFSFDYIIN